MARLAVSENLRPHQISITPREFDSEVQSYTTTTVSGVISVRLTVTNTGTESVTVPKTVKLVSDISTGTGMGPSFETDNATTSTSSSSRTSTQSTSSSHSEMTSSSRSQSSSEDDETTNTEKHSQTTSEDSSEATTTSQPATSSDSTDTISGDDDESSSSTSSSSSSSSESTSSSVGTTTQESSSTLSTMTSMPASPTSTLSPPVSPTSPVSSSPTPSPSASAAPVPIGGPNLSIGSITGISVGAAAAFFLLIFLASWSIRNRREKRRHAAMTPDDYVPGVWPRPYDPNRNTSMENTNTESYTRPSTLSRPLSQIGAGRFYAPATQRANIPLPRTPTVASVPQFSAMEQVYEAPSRPATAPLPADAMEMRNNPMRSNTSLGRGPKGVQEPLENEYRGIQMTSPHVPGSLRPGHRRQITPPWKTATELYAEQHGGRQWQAPAW